MEKNSNGNNYYSMIKQTELRCYKFAGIGLSGALHEQILVIKSEKRNFVQLDKNNQFFNFFRKKKKHQKNVDSKPKLCVSRNRKPLIRIVQNSGTLDPYVREEATYNNTNFAKTAKFTWVFRIPSQRKLSKQNETAE